jgi:hypothetical protein
MTASSFRCRTAGQRRQLTRALPRAALLPTLALAAVPALADWQDVCRHSQEIERTVDLAEVRQVSVRAGAGPLEIRGTESAAASGRLVLTGLACASREQTLGRMDVDVRLRGDTLEVATRIPADQEALIELEIELPDDVALDVIDSSGSLELRNVRSVELRDSSGSIDIADVRGAVHIASDSSGSIDIRDAGEVTIDRDSSGSITVENAATLTVGEDGSGSITARHIAGDVYVGRDGSGSIEVTDVGGNFTVVRDGSGDVRHHAVAGVVDLGRSERRDR